MFKTSVNHVMLQTTVPNMEKSFVNISDVDEFWSWTQSALVTGLHHRELYTDLEFGTLLGVARMRLVRSIEGWFSLVFDRMFFLGIDLS